MDNCIWKTTVSLKYIVEPSQIGFINGILEAFDGYGVLRTLDRARGLIVIWASPDFMQETIAVMNSFKELIYIKPAKHFIEVTKNEELTF